MTIRLELTPEVEAGLLNQAQENGMSLEAFAEQVLTQKSRAGLLNGNTDCVDAVRRLATFGKRHNLSLGGITVKELLRESRP